MLLTRNTQGQAREGAKLKCWQLGTRTHTHTRGSSGRPRAYEDICKRAKARKGAEGSDGPCCTQVSTKATWSRPKACPHKSHLAPTHQCQPGQPMHCAAGPLPAGVASAKAPLGGRRLPAPHEELIEATACTCSRGRKQDEWRAVQSPGLSCAKGTQRDVAGGWRLPTCSEASDGQRQQRCGGRGCPAACWRSGAPGGATAGGLQYPHKRHALGWGRALVLVLRAAASVRPTGGARTKHD